jgi:hypothetical protein
MELCPPVLDASRDFFVDAMGLREVHRDGTSCSCTWCLTAEARKPLWSRCRPGTWLAVRRMTTSGIDKLRTVHPFDL